MSYIYKITNNINNKAYIGKTNKTVQERFAEHCKDAFRPRCQQRPLYDAMQKYGIENFTIEELEQCSDTVVNDRESFWIEYYATFKNGYNATKGGDGKSYIDYDLVVATYMQLQNIKQTAEKLQIHSDSVSNILKLRNITIKSSAQIIKDNCGKIVHMYDKKTGEYLQTFATMRDAGQYLIDNGLSNCKLTTIRQHISEVCRGIRKSAAGFKWCCDTEKENS